MHWIDAHCHLDLIFDQVGDQAFETSFRQWQLAGVRQFVVPAVGGESWRTISKLAARFPGIHGCLGVHPCFLREDYSQALSIFDALPGMSGIVAVGEIGLHAGLGNDAVQREIFVRQVEIAAYWKLPIVVHSYRCHDEIFSLLKKKRFSCGGLLHGFSGSYKQAMNFVSIQFCLGVGGVLTWPRASKTRDTLSRVPLEALMIETDSPDMPLPGMAKGQNTPLSIPMIFDALAAARPESPAHIAEKLLLNTAKVFKFAV
ncbi:MAG: TatD family hydrolase [Hahellaceae bacterium]|nr:TatD family hydrolase [Hahellaceae bacterium]MCP5169834.1 TatD family hydrolase [Hahellaceae bacterium]